MQLPALVFSLQILFRSLPERGRLSVISTPVPYQFSRVFFMLPRFSIVVRSKTYCLNLVVTCHSHNNYLADPVLKPRVPCHRFFIPYSDMLFAQRHSVSDPWISAFYLDDLFIQDMILCLHSHVQVIMPAYPVSELYLLRYFLKISRYSILMEMIHRQF